jgi:hypothetical protein
MNTYLKFFIFVMMIYLLLVSVHWNSFRSESTYANQSSPTTVQKFKVSIFTICAINLEILGFEDKFSCHD